MLDFLFGHKKTTTTRTITRTTSEKMYSLDTLEQSCMYFANTTYIWTIEEVRDWIKENYGKFADE